MIKGALILGVGFALGYAKALHDTPEVRQFVARIWEDILVSAEVISKTETSSAEPDLSKTPPVSVQSIDNPTEGESHG